MNLAIDMSKKPLSNQNIGALRFSKSLCLIFLEDGSDLKRVFCGAVEFDILLLISLFCLHFATTDTLDIGCQ